MRKVIDGKLYNTETAKQVGSDSYSHYGDFQYWCEELYCTERGNWFLYGEGGEKFSYARSVEQNAAGGGNDITPLTREEALAWLAARNTDPEAIEEFQLFEANEDEKEM